MSQPTLDKAMLEKYAVLKANQKMIEAELEELAPQIREAMRASDTDKVNTDFGAFTLSNRTTYKYSQAVTDLQEKEKANGTAKQLVSTVLYFKAPKVNS